MAPLVGHFISASSINFSMLSGHSKNFGVSRQGVLSWQVWDTCAENRAELDELPCIANARNVLIFVSSSPVFVWWWGHLFLRFLRHNSHTVLPYASVTSLRIFLPAFVGIIQESIAWLRVRSCTVPSVWLTFCPVLSSRMTYIC